MDFKRLLISAVLVMAAAAQAFGAGAAGKWTASIRRLAFRITPTRSN
jgi:hypothetical protein